MANVGIAAAIAAGCAAQTVRLAAEADEAREQNAFIALADPIDIVDEHGNLLPLQKMPRRIRCAIKSIEIVKRNVTSGDGLLDTTYKITFWDKSKALEMEYKHHGLLVERLEMRSDAELLAALERGRQRNANRGDTD